MPTTSARAFLVDEVEALAPFEFVAAGPSANPLHMLEVTRLEAGALEVRVPGRPAIVPELTLEVRTRLRDRGFASEQPDDPSRPWTHAAADAAEAADLLLAVLGEVFEEKPELRLNVAHGSHRAEHEVQQKLALVRKRIEQVVTAMAGGQPPQQDPEADYTLPVDDVHVTVAPRAVPGGLLIVRVFAITNVGVNVTPELGLFLARLNFGLMFGRFALDAEHRSIWFDETLLGEHFSDEELEFTIGVVARTADEWDDRLKQMFGGSTQQEVLVKDAPQEPPPTKPGHGVYL